MNQIFNRTVTQLFKQPISQLANRIISH